MIGQRLHRRMLFGLAAGAAFAPGLAQGSYPDRPIRLVVPFPPGATVDVTARLVAAKAAELLGGDANFVVENLPGAGGNIATQRVARMNGRWLHAAVHRAEPHRQSRPIPDSGYRPGARLRADLPGRADPRDPDRAGLGALSDLPEFVAYARQTIRQAELRLGRHRVASACRDGTDAAPARPAGGARARIAAPRRR